MRRSLTVVRKKCSRYGNSLRGFRRSYAPTLESAGNEEDQSLPADEAQEDTAKIGESDSKHVYRSKSLRSFTRCQDAGVRYVRSLGEGKAHQSPQGSHTRGPADSDDEKEIFIISREALDAVLQAKHGNTLAPGAIPLSEVHPALRPSMKDDNSISLSSFPYQGTSGTASIPVSSTPTEQIDSAHPSPNQPSEQKVKRSSSASKHRYSIYPPPTLSLPPLPLPMRSPLRHASRYQLPPSSAHTMPKSVYEDPGSFTSSSHPRSENSPCTFSKATSKLANAIMQLSDSDVDFNEARIARAGTPDWLSRISTENAAERLSALPDSPTLGNIPKSSQTGVGLPEREVSDGMYILPATTCAPPQSTVVLPDIGDSRRRSEEEEKEVPVFLETPEST